MKEIAILKYLNHPNVLPIYGIDLNIDNCKFFYAMPLAKGDLVESIKKGLNLQERKMIMYQLLRGLAYCHTNFVWHLDLKPGNILEFDNGEYKLADFGISVIYEVNGKPHSTYVVTLWYRPPEILLESAYYTETADVWSMGAILAEMILGRPLFHGNSETDVLYRIFRVLGTPNNRTWPGVERLPQYKTSFPRWNGTGFRTTFANEDPEEVSILRDMLAWPNNRKKAIDLLNYSYFDEIRMIIEQKFPDAPIVELDCGELMLLQQVLIPKPKSGILSNPTSDARYKGFRWLWGLYRSFKLKPRTLFLAYIFNDAYASLVDIPTNKLQLLLVTSLSLASKMNEMYNIPIVDLSGVTAGTYSKKEIIDMEITLLATLDFNLIFPSCGNFSDYLISNKTAKPIQKLMYDLMVIIMINNNWPFELNQHEVAQSGIDIALLLYRSTGTRCLRRLKGGKSLSFAEINNYLQSLYPSTLSRTVQQQIETAQSQ